MSAHTEGAKAYERWANEGDNPYLAGTKRHRRWMEGWLVAQAEHVQTLDPWEGTAREVEDLSMGGASS